MTAGTREPYTGPRTGDFDASLALLARLAERQAAETVTRTLPAYTGPVTGQQEALPSNPERLRVTTKIPRIPTGIEAASAGSVRRRVVALVPAFNEEEQIASTLAGLMTQWRQPDEVIVVCDNCTDLTPNLAALAGAKVFYTEQNKHKKAGGLNQVLATVLPRLGPDDVVLVVDADTSLAPRFVQAAIRALDLGAGACGGVFYGDEGGGLLGIFQRNEYCRYARTLSRNMGQARVLTGTASAFTVRAFRELAEARRSGRLPGAQPGAAMPVYTTASLTEDGEITLALKTLGFKCVSPGECAVTTEIMTTWRTWWKQRTRWQRGALEDLRTYGLTKVTAPYIARQCLMGLSVAAFALYIAYSVATIALYGYHTDPLWLSITGVFVLERAVTVRRGGWREIATAALIFPELFYDAVQHAVWLSCVAGALLRTRTNW